MRSSIVSKKIMILFTVFLVSSLLFHGDILAYDFSDWYHGAPGYEAALNDAMNEEKPLVLYFHRESCKWCKKLNSEYLASYDVGQFLSEIPRVEFSSAKEDLEKALYDKYGVTGVPAFFVLIPALDSKPDKRISPFSKNKHMATHEFINAIKRRITYKYNNKGLSLYKEKQYEKALKYYEMTLNFDPENVYAYYAAGIVYHTIGYDQKDPTFIEKAKENYSKALEIDPNHEGSRKGLENLQESTN
ncbi:MAG: tetratricopeptide repeat protein [Desulfobacteraceae bacterium]|nr:MAG: tetratricopeptide repeat protein [Desulfobacteraceae bacterium]